MYISSGFNKEILFYEKLKYLGRSRKPQSGKQFFAVATLKVISLLSKERKFRNTGTPAIFHYRIKAWRTLRNWKKSTKATLETFQRCRTRPVVFLRFSLRHLLCFTYKFFPPVKQIFYKFQLFPLNFNETAEKCTESLGKMVPIEFHHFFSKCKRIASFSLQVWIQQVKEPCKFTMKIIFARVNKF